MLLRTQRVRLRHTISIGKHRVHSLVNARTVTGSERCAMATTIMEEDVLIEIPQLAPLKLSPEQMRALSIDVSVRIHPIVYKLEGIVNS
jgi:hypothetical protein